MNYNKKHKSEKKNWIISGLIFGILMFLVNQIIFPLIKGEKITSQVFLIWLPIWLVGGLGWGFVMRWWYRRQEKRNQNKNTQK